MPQASTCTQVIAPVLIAYPNKTTKNVGGGGPQR